MRLRGAVLGLVGAAFICGVSYFNDAVMHQTYVVGNNMPITVFGCLILFLLAVNPLLGRISPRLLFTGRDMAVALALTLAACCIPGSGLMRTFPSSLLLPHHFERTEPGWKDQGVMDMAPEAMLADVSGDEAGTVLNGFIQGLGVGDKHIRFSEIPWYAWSRTLMFWIPVILSLWIALIGLSLVVHRQWADHEQLPYPIAQFADSLLPGKGQSRGTVFQNRLFWIGTAIVLLIHLNNYANRWFPTYTIPVQLSFKFWSLNGAFPTIAKGGGWAIFNPRLYLTVIAFAYFLAADVSLSLGIGPIVFAYVSGLFLAAGISLGGGGYLALKPQTFLNFGAYIGLFLALLYTGRHYYRNIFRRAIWPGKAKDSTDTAAVWGARAAIVGVLVFVGNLTWLGLDWQLAVLYALGIVTIFVVMARIIAETGLFFIQPYTFPCVVIWGVFGAKALGPQSMLILMMVTVVLLVDPRESLMPFLVNGLRTVDLRNVKLGRTAILCAVALFVGLATAIPVQLYLQYDRGSNMADAWASRVVPKMPFQEAVRIKQRLSAQDSLELSQSLSGWSRFREMAPDPYLLLAFAAGLGLVLIFTTCRLRFPKWPFHPVLFLVWNTYPGKAFAASFLIGCLVKAMVTKYGGPAVYRKLKPLMFGLIAGEMLGGVVPALIGLVYYLVTGGELPQPFAVMPG